MNSESNESEFYNLIVEITNYSSYENTLRRDSQIITDVIIKDYKRNIHLAALRGLNKAYICIYEIGAKYKDIIPIDIFIRMNEEMEEKFKALKMETVINRIKKKLYPFVVEVKKLSEIDLKDATVDPIVNSQQNIQDTGLVNNLIGIMVSWEKNK